MLIKSEQPFRKWAIGKEVLAWEGNGVPEVGLPGQSLTVLDAAGQFGIFGLCCARCESSIRERFAR